VSRGKIDNGLFIDSRRPHSVCIDGASLDSLWRHAQDGRRHVMSGRINYVVRKSHCIQNARRRTFSDHTLNRYHNPSLGSSQWADIMTHTIKDISAFIHSYLHEIPCLGKSRWPHSLLWRSDSARTPIATLLTYLIRQHTFCLLYPCCPKPTLTNRVSRMQA
jgi:hypothetical protein